MTTRTRGRVRGGAGGSADLAPATSGGPTTTTATATGSASSTTGASSGGGEGGRDAGAGGAPPSTVCERTAVVEIVDVVVDADPWRPGETATVTATVVSPVDHFEYPGVRVRSNHPYVTAAGSEANHLFGLLAGEPAAIGIAFTAADLVDAGTRVTFDVEVVTLVEECVGLDTETLVATLE